MTCVLLGCLGSRGLRVCLMKGLLMSGPPYATCHSSSPYAKQSTARRSTAGTLHYVQALSHVREGSAAVAASPSPVAAASDFSYRPPRKPLRPIIKPDDTMVWAPQSRLRRSAWSVPLSRATKGRVYRRCSGSGDHRAGVLSNDVPA